LAILQEDKPLLRLPIWTTEWNALAAGKSWLGQKGDALSFFHRDELVWRDNDYLGELFKGQVAVWKFDDLAELAKKLGIAPCSNAEPIFSPLGEQESLNDWTENLRRATPEIRCFLTSPKWREHLRVSASLDVLPKLEVRLIEEAKVSFRLKEVVIPEAEARSSYLDGNGNTVWLVLKAAQSEFPELIGEVREPTESRPLPHLRRKRGTAGSDRTVWRKTRAARHTQPSGRQSSAGAREEFRAESDRNAPHASRLRCRIQKSSRRHRKIHRSEVLSRRLGQKGRCFDQNAI
jgi:hypothetical protein